jgi:hypothetical protein
LTSRVERGREGFAVMKTLLAAKSRLAIRSCSRGNQPWRVMRTTAFETATYSVNQRLPAAELAL